MDDTTCADAATTDTLRNAAHAAGYNLKRIVRLDGKAVIERVPGDGQPFYWHPLQQPGDALRLAADVHINLRFVPGNGFESLAGVEATCMKLGLERSSYALLEDHNNDASEAACVAILTTAANVGAAMKAAG
jgi:hypothetical protein